MNIVNNQFNVELDT